MKTTFSHFSLVIISACIIFTGSLTNAQSFQSTSSATQLKLHKSVLLNQTKNKPQTSCNGILPVSRSSQQPGVKTFTWCLSDKVTDNYIFQQSQADLDFPNKMNKMYGAIQQWIDNNPNYLQQKALKTIPVVIHIVYNTPDENVSNSLVYDMLNILNEDFQRLNSDTNQTRSVFKPVAADAQIEFCLAQRDPSNNATTGITRTTTTKTYFDPDSETDDMKKNSTGGKDAWDPTKYLNIWIADIDNGAGFGTAGYAYLPTPGMHGSWRDGLVLDNNIGLCYGCRTATHEIGHYLGLKHTWGNNPPGCTGDDGFSDTPTSASENFGCNTSQNTCNDGVGDMVDQIENYMSYADCQNMFSAQQSTYMNSTLNTTRNSLLVSTACQPTAAPVADFYANDSTITEGQYVQFFDQSSGGATSWSWNFGGGGTPNTSVSQNPFIQFNTIGTYNVSLTATNSLGSDVETKLSHISVTADLSPCDTINWNFLANDTSLTIYGCGATCGNVVGTNQYDDKAKAQLFTASEFSPNTHVTGGLFYFAKAYKSGTSNGKVVFSVWDDNGTAGAPNTILGTDTVDLADIVSDVQGGYLTQCLFIPPVAVSGNYYFGFQMLNFDNWAGGTSDSIALVQTTDGVSASASIPWEQWSDNSWSDFISAWGFISNTIFATPYMTDMPPVASFTADTVEGCGELIVDFDASSTLNGVEYYWDVDGDDTLDYVTYTPDISIQYNGTGTYSVSLWVVGVCDGMDSVMRVNYIRVNDVPVLTTSSNNSACGSCSGNATVSITGGTSPFSYLWNDPAPAQTAAAATGLCPGTYNVLVSDAKGCKSSSGISITDPGNLSLSVSTTNEYCNNSGGTATAAASGGTTPYTYQWDAGSGNQTTQTATGLNSGTYFVTVTDNIGCFVSTDFYNSAVINNVNGTIDISFSVSGVQCNGDSSGSATAIPSGGNTPYSYLWSNNATSAGLSGLPAGTYFVTVTDINGCSDTGSTTISAPAPLSAVLSGTDETSAGANDGTATATTIGGTTPYSYFWSNSDNTPTITGLTPGTYYVTVTDNNGCTVSDSEIVNAFIVPVCISSIPYGNANAPENNIQIIITNCNYAGEFATIDSISIGETYQFSSSVSTDWLTLTDGNDSLLVNGTTALTWIATLNGTVHLHVYADSVCGTQNTCRATSVQCTSCPPVPCLSTTPYGNANAPANNTEIDITTCNYAGEYATIDSISAGETYQFSSSVSTDWLTLTDTSDNVLLDGTTALTWLATLSGTVHLHINTDSVCGIQNTCRVTSVQCTTCPQGPSCVGSLAYGNAAAPANNVEIAIDSCNWAGDYATVTSVVSGQTYLFSSSVSTDWLTLTQTNYNLLIEGTSSISWTATFSGNVLMHIHADSSCGTQDTCRITAVQCTTCCSGFSVTANSTNETTTGANDGTATAAMVGGTSPYIYLWNNGGTTNPIDSLSPGIYSVSVTDSNGCSSQSNDVVVNAAGCNMTVVASLSSPILCNGGSTGSAAATISNGIPPYTYQWSNGDSTSSASNLSSGTINISVSDGNGCFASNALTLTEPSAITAGVGINQALCFGDTGNATISSSGGGTGTLVFSWQGGGTGTFKGNLVAGNYDVTVTDANSCFIIVPYSITEPPSLNVSVSSTDETSAGANDGTASATTSGGTTPYSYAWSNSDITQIVTGLPPGTYYVTATDANGCLATDSAVVNPFIASSCFSSTPYGNANASGNNGPVVITNCNYAGEFATIGSITVGETYQFSSSIATDWLTLTDVNDSLLIEGTNPLAWLATFSDTVRLHVHTDSLCGTQDTCRATSVQCTSCPQSTSCLSTTPYGNADAPVNNTEINITTCNYAGEYATIDSISAGETYQFSSSVSTDWLTLTDTNDSLLMEGTTALIWLATFNGTVHLHVNTDSACGTQNTCRITSVQCTTCPQGPSCVGSLAYGNAAAPTNDIEIAIDSCNWAGDFATVTSVVLGQTYLFSSSVSTDWLTLTETNNNLLVEGTTSISWTATFSGGVHLHIHADSSCGTQDSCRVTAVQCTTCCSGFFVTATGTNETTSGANDGTAAATVVGGTTPYSFSWNNGGTTNAIDSLSPGIYSVYVTDSNGCSDQSNNVVVNAAGCSMTVSASATSQILCNGESTGSATVTISNGIAPFTYQWSNGDSTASAFNLSAGSVNIVVSDSNGCLATSTVTIIEPPSILVSVSIINAMCNGGTGSASLTSSGGTGNFSYNWSNGGSGTSQTGLSAGNFSVTVTDANSCNSVVPFVVNEPSTLIVSVSSTNETSAGANNGTGTASAAGGTTPFSYLWSNSATSNTISGLSPGTYSVTLTDANGCSASGSTIVNPFGCNLVLNSVNVTFNINCNGGNDGEATVSVSAGTTPFTYSWSNGDATLTADSLVAGTYDVTVTDNGGCGVVGSVTLSQPLLLAGSVSSTNETSYGSNDGTATALATGGTTGYTYTWSNGQTTSVATGLSPGNYCVTVTDANGCSVNSCGSVNAFVCNLAATASSTDETSSGANDGTATATQTGGTSPFTYFWGNLQTTPTITGLSPGTYCVTITDSQNCSDSVCVTVNAGVACNVAVSVSAIDETSAGASDGSATAAVTGGTTPYFYLWNTVPAQTTQTISGLAPGNYCVTVTDLDSCTAFACDSVFPGPGSVAETDNGFIVSLFPNPVSGNLYIQVSLDSPDKVFIEARNFLGQVIQTLASEKTMLYKATVNTEKWSAGVYFVSVKTRDRIKIERVMVE